MNTLLCCEVCSIELASCSLLCPHSTRLVNHSIVYLVHFNKVYSIVLQWWDSDAPPCVVICGIVLNGLYYKKQYGREIVIVLVSVPLTKWRTGFPFFHTHENLRFFIYLVFLFLSRGEWRENLLLVDFVFVILLFTVDMTLWILINSLKRSANGKGRRFREGSHILIHLNTYCILHTAYIHPVNFILVHVPSPRKHPSPETTLKKKYSVYIYRGV